MEKLVWLVLPFCVTAFTTPFNSSLTVIILSIWKAKKYPSKNVPDTDKPNSIYNGEGQKENLQNWSEKMKGNVRGVEFKIQLLFPLTA